MVFHPGGSGSGGQGTLASGSFPRGCVLVPGAMEDQVIDSATGDIMFRCWIPGFGCMLYERYSEETTLDVQARLARFVPWIRHGSDPLCSSRDG